MVYREQPKPQGQTQPKPQGQTTTSDTARQSTGQQDGGSKADQVKEQAGQAANQAKEQAGQAVNQAKEQASEVADKATQAVDQRREQASGKLDTAAVQLRESGEKLPGGERSTEMASMAADKVEATSSYIREHDVQDMKSDLETLVRSHPTQSLVAAAAAGFLVGRMLRG